jgi:hypothetical protein
MECLDCIEKCSIIINSRIKTGLTIETTCDSIRAFNSLVRIIFGFSASQEIKIDATVETLEMPLEMLAIFKKVL